MSTRYSKETRRLLAQIRRHIRALQDQELDTLVRHYSGDQEALREHSALYKPIGNAKDVYAFLAARGSVDAMPSFLRPALDQIIGSSAAKEAA